MMRFFTRLSLLALVLLASCQKESADPNSPDGFVIEDFSKDFLPTGNTWEILDEKAYMDDFEGLQDALVVATEAGRMIDLVFPNLTSLPDRALFEPNEEDRAINDIQSLRSISAPKVESIGTYAFSGISTLEQLNFPACETMKSNAFRDCSALVDVSEAFPALTEMEEYSFALCTSLEKVYFPLLESLERKMFWGCTSLTDLSGALPKVEQVHNYAFWGCTSLSNIVDAFPVVTKISFWAFEGCTSLSNIVGAFPLVEEVGMNAFAGCSSLVEVALPAVSSLGDNVFYDCNVLTNLELATGSEVELTTLGAGIFDSAAGGSRADAITLVLGNGNGVLVSGETLTVGANAYTFDEILFKR